MIVFEGLKLARPALEFEPIVSGLAMDCRMDVRALYEKRGKRGEESEGNLVVRGKSWLERYGSNWHYPVTIE